MPPKGTKAKKKAGTKDATSQPEAMPTKVAKATTTAKLTKGPVKPKPAPMATTPPSTPEARAGAEASDAESETAGQPTSTPATATPGAFTAGKQKKKRSPNKTSRAGGKAVNYVILRDTLDDEPELSVSSDNQTTLAKSNPTNNDFELIAKISSAHEFRFLGTVSFTEGPHKDHFAIIFKPSKPFNFLGLPVETRRIILRLVFAPQGYRDGKIGIVSCKTKMFKAKDYSEGLENRVGILRANKEIYEEARPILYDNVYRFSDTDVLMEFLTLTTSEVRRLMTYIQIDKYKKKSAMTAIRVLADCVNVTRIHINSGVGVKSTPIAAAKNFFSNAAHLARVFNSVKGPGHATRVLRFSPGIENFSLVDGDELREYGDEEYKVFQDKLRDLMK